ncbi:hypothetical protein CR513_33781, partial [Mucuna pruriens]
MSAFPPILTRPILGKLVFVYISILNNVVSSVILAIVITTKKLRPYFQIHPVICRTDLSIRQILQKPNSKGTYEGLGASRFHEQTDPKLPRGRSCGANKEWTLSIDGSSNKRGSGVGVILEGPSVVLIEQSLHFGFQESNNRAEYKTLLAGIWLAKELGVKILTIKSDSQMITGQLSRYLGTVKAQAETLERFTLLHVPREQNEKVDLLAKLASTPPSGVRRIKREATKYVLIVGQLYRQERVIKEVDEGACGSHIGGRALASKIARAGFYWSTIKRDSLVFVIKCDKLDILGPFPLAIGKVKFFLVAIDYFTKWIEVELVAMISTERVRLFYWKRIICRFRLPAVTVSDKVPNLNHGQ